MNVQRFLLANRCRQASGANRSISSFESSLSISSVDSRLSAVDSVDGFDRNRGREAEAADRQVLMLDNPYAYNHKPVESPSPLKLTYLRTKSSSSSSEHSSNHDEFSSNSYAYNHEPVETPTPPKLMYPCTKSSSSSEQGSCNHDESSLNSSIPTEIELWTKEELLFYGLSWVGYDRAKQQKVNKKRNLTRWREHYGPPPATYAPVVNGVRS
ncbi:hypothetical protein ACHAWO_004275 [Cyclotella atomus]|uniref:Myb-like domain-containing protein n=1 Tax=Cyclotella atomus TaxID=382360 RepID=A0ABD3QC27_9STRA